MNNTQVKTLDLLYTTDGKSKEKNYTLCTENVVRILMKHESFIDRVRKDKFRNVIEIKNISNPNQEWEMISDSNTLLLMNELASAFNFLQKLSKSMICDAIEVVAQNNHYDSAIEYVKSLTWDGTERLNTWLHHVYGTRDDHYHQSIGSNWIKGMVKRIIQPGAKFDHVLVIEGAQGTGKSSAFRALAGDWYVETSMNTESKDFFMQFQGKIIIEFSEGETLSKTDVKRMKSIITTQVDRYRIPYSRNTEDFPRRCVFAMTTNDDQYLKDSTGNRRWLPVKAMVKKINTQWIIENRDQLFAEAYHRLTVLNETYWEFPEEELEKEQLARLQLSPDHETIENWYWNKLKPEDREEGVEIKYIWERVLHNNTPGVSFMTSVSLMTKKNEMDIADVLKAIGLRAERVSRNGIRASRWFLRPELQEKTTLKITEYKETKSQGQSKSNSASIASNIALRPEDQDF